MKKGTVKKTIKNILISSLAVLTIGTASLHVSSEIVHNENSSISQTYDLQDNLKVVADYRNNLGARLKHNGNEPIYVSISNEFSEEQRNIIINGLNNIFGLVGDINNKYNYEIVENLNDLKYFNKTTIKFNFDEIAAQAEGNAHSEYSLFALSSKGHFIKGGTISFDKEVYQKSNNKLDYMVKHELLHLFGLSDIYEKEDTYLNTFMNIHQKDFVNMISPNDYNLLLSMYAENLNEYSDDEKNNYIESLQKKSDDYRQKYYENYSNNRKESYKNNNLILNESQITSDIDVVFSNIYSVDKNISTIRIKTEGNAYTIATYDTSGNIIEKHNGKCMNVNGEIFLQDVHMKSLYKGNETFVDLQITHDSKSNKYKLSSLVLNLESSKGIEFELFNTSTQNQ